jgi:hypothetical protein
MYIPSFQGVLKHIKYNAVGSVAYAMSILTSTLVVAKRQRNTQSSPLAIPLPDISGFPFEESLETWQGTPKWMDYHCKARTWQHPKTQWPLWTNQGLL